MSTVGLRKDKGFSLVEMIIALAVISLVFGLLLSGLFFGNLVNHKAKISTKLFHDQRYLNLYFQKQILESEKIYFKEGRVYLQDLESPDQYYNYYRNVNGLLRRYKVYKGTLTTIGSGGNSQFADSITNFSLSLAPDDAIILRYTLTYEGESVERETIIEHGKTVETLEED